MFRPDLDNTDVQYIAKLLIHQSRIAVCDCDCPCNCLDKMGDFGLDIDSCTITVNGKTYAIHAALGPHPKPAIPPDDDWTCNTCGRPDGQCTC
jgi:hypothetical protein